MPRTKNSNQTSSSQAKSRKQVKKRKPQHIAVPSLPLELQQAPQDNADISVSSQDSVAAPICISDSQHTVPPQLSQAEQHHVPEERVKDGQMTMLYFDMKLTPIYV
ncbi:hypothetical protein H0H93_016868, partial [Arthromyces matolae]